jgi:hypothetical protein
MGVIPEGTRNYKGAEGNGTHSLSLRAFLARFDALFKVKAAFVLRTLGEWR